MANVNLTYKQENLVYNAARKYGFRNFEVDANIGTLKGDNYLGVVTAIKVKGKDDNRELHLILKSAHTNENFRKGVPVAQAFAREAYMYTKILPRLQEFQNEKVISDPFTGAAKLYGCCLEDSIESILMEDLKKNQYKLWNRFVPMNDEHVTVVFSEYARFHAASFALRHYYPEEFAELTKDIKLSVFESKEPRVVEYENVSDLYFKSGFSGVEGNAKATAALEKFQKNIKELFIEYPKHNERNKHEQVITHGDCWSNNMLFQYEENGTIPKKVCFIDWQIAKVGSPVLDLAYFFSVCSSKKVLHQLTKYLNIYHKVFSKNLIEFGCDPEILFNFDRLLHHWKTYSWFGVLIGMMIIKLMLSDSEEAPDINKIIDEGHDLMDAFDFTMSEDSKYKTRICDLVEFMADNKFI